MFKKRILIFTLFIAGLSPLFSQEEVVDKKTLYWTRLYLEVPLSKNKQLDIELDNRRFFNPPSQFQSLVRTTYVNKRTEHLSLGIGFAFSLNYSQVSNIVQPEYRPHQQIKYSHFLNRFTLKHRLRIEQQIARDAERQLSETEEIEALKDFYVFTLRSRYQFNVEFALIEKNKNLLSLNSASEVMVNTLQTDFFNTFRQYIGINYAFRENTQIELGYLKSLEMEHNFNILYNFNNLRLTLRQRI